MKYISFDLEVSKDSFPSYYFVRYSSFGYASIIFTDKNDSTDYTSRFVIKIEAPVTISKMNQDFGDILDQKEVKLEKTGQRNYNKDQLLITSNAYYKPAIRVAYKLIIANSDLKSFEKDCLPKIKIKNIKFEDRYKSWLDSDWFSLDGINENTVLE